MVNDQYFTIQFTIHNSLFTIHHSQFTIHHSPFTIHHSPFTIHHSPLTIHHSLTHKCKKVFFIFLRNIHSLPYSSAFASVSLLPYWVLFQVCSLPLPIYYFSVFGMAPSSHSWAKRWVEGLPFCCTGKVSKKQQKKDYKNTKKYSGWWRPVIKKHSTLFFL